MRFHTRNWLSTTEGTVQGKPEILGSLRKGRSASVPRDVIPYRQNVFFRETFNSTLKPSAN